MHTEQNAGQGAHQGLPLLITDRTRKSKEEHAKDFGIFELAFVLETNEMSNQISFIAGERATFLGV